MPWMEAVPNFSEGRDPARVEALLSALLSVPEVYLLDQEMDADHNRSVITLAGEPAAVAEAAVRGAGKAAELIDLNLHRGAHPRIGACDVIPFVPLESMSLEDCVHWAQWAGEQIWRRFQIPVYLYEAAARRPERQRLENIRQGQFEGLREAIVCNPDRRPDFGPPEGQPLNLHPTAGATAVGARKFLIAYNVNLDSPDAAVARAIARKIRSSGGGLPALKAMGVQLSSPPRAQVSMNLTDFEQTSLAAAWNAVAQEAGQAGVSALESELVGLVPRQALIEAAVEALHIRAFDHSSLIEHRLATVRQSLPARWEAQLQPFVAALSAATPAPGGGSAAAAAGALAAALGTMLIAYVEKKRLPAPQGWTWPALMDDFARACRELLRSTDLDCDAYLAVVAARKLPRDTGEKSRQRDSAIEQAIRRAAEVPLAVAVLSRGLRGLFRLLSPSIPAGMRSDLITAQALNEACFQGASANVDINMHDLDEHSPGYRRLHLELERLRALDEAG